MRMAGLRFIYSLTFCLCLATQTNAYSNGAPDGACDNMTPSHNVPPMENQAPFQVTTSQNTIGPGEQIDVTISGGGSFKGFLIRARQNNGYVSGQFQSNSQAQLSCNGGGITHNSPSPKTSLTVTWTAPTNLGSSPVQFVATVVQQRTSFWISIPSPAVAVRGIETSGSPTTGSPTTSGKGPMATGNSGTSGRDDDDDDDDDGNGGNIMKVGPGWLLAVFIASNAILFQ